MQKIAERLANVEDQINEYGQLLDGEQQIIFRTLDNTDAVTRNAKVLFQDLAVVVGNLQKTCDDGLVEVVHAVRELKQKWIENKII